MDFNTGAGTANTGKVRWRGVTDRCRWNDVRHRWSWCDKHCSRWHSVAHAGAGETCSSSGAGGAKNCADRWCWRDLLRRDWSKRGVHRGRQCNVSHAGAEEMYYTGAAAETTAAGGAA